MTKYSMVATAIATRRPQTANQAKQSAIPFLEDQFTNDAQIGISTRKGRLVSRNRSREIIAPRPDGTPVRYRCNVAVISRPNDIVIDPSRQRAVQCLTGIALPRGDRARKFLSAALEHAVLPLRPVIEQQRKLARPNEKLGRVHEIQRHCDRRPLDKSTFQGQSPKRSRESFHSLCVFPPFRFKNQNVVPARSSQHYHRFIRGRFTRRPLVLRLKLIIQKHDASIGMDYREVTIPVQSDNLYAFVVPAGSNVAVGVNMCEKCSTIGTIDLDDNATVVRGSCYQRRSGTERRLFP